VLFRSQPVPRRVAVISGSFHVVWQHCRELVDVGVLRLGYLYYIYIYISPYS